MCEWVKLMLPLINVSCQASQPNTHYFFHKLEPRIMQFLLHQLNIMHYTWQHLPKVKSSVFSDFNFQSRVLLHRQHYTEINGSISEKLWWSYTQYESIDIFCFKVKRNLKENSIFLILTTSCISVQSNFTWTFAAAVVNHSS